MKQADIVSGCFFGDCSKGSITDFLARQGDVEVIVRYNGGPQAGHHVVTKDGRVHRFGSFGSGTLIPGIRSHFSSQTLIKIGNIEDEEEQLRSIGVSDAMERLSIDPSCSLIMPYHVMIGRMLEASRGKNRFGSVGIGVGQAVLDRRKRGEEALKFGDLQHPSQFRAKARQYWRENTHRGLEMIKRSGNSYVESIYQSFIDFIEVNEMADRQLRFFDRYPNLLKTDAEVFASISGRAVFEGAQGALLDQTFGFVPHITRSYTLASSAEKLLQDNKIECKVRKIGILRAYATRHGAGPFPTESEELGQAIPDYHHPEGEWTGKFRIGHFDLILARYALAINKNLDFLALTCLDRLSVLDKIKICRSYQYLGDWGPDLDRFFDCERGEVIEIYGIKPRSGDEEEQKKLTEYLFRCMPLRFLEFPSWETNATKNQPQELLSLLDFLESPDGLNMPIGIISTGLTAEDKFYRH